MTGRWGRRGAMTGRGGGGLGDWVMRGLTGLGRGWGNNMLQLDCEGDRMSDERVGAVGLGDKVRDRGGVGNDIGSVTEDGN